MEGREVGRKEWEWEKTEREGEGWEEQREEGGGRCAHDNET